MTKSIFHNCQSRFQLFLNNQACDDGGNKIRCGAFRLFIRVNFCEISPLPLRSLWTKGTTSRKFNHRVDFDTLTCHEHSGGPFQPSTLCLNCAISKRWVKHQDLPFYTILFLFFFFFLKNVVKTKLLFVIYLRFWNMG